MTNVSLAIESLTLNFFLYDILKMSQEQVCYLTDPVLVKAALPLYRPQPCYQRMWE